MARVGLIVLVAALAVAGAACRSEPDARDRVAQAQAATLEAGSASFSITQSFTGKATGEQRIEGRGTLDFQARRGQLTVNAPTAGASAGAGQFQTVFDGTAYYLRLPLIELPTRWVRMDLGDDGPVSLDQLRELSGDPSRNLAMLQGAGDDVDVVGQEQVGSAMTTRYRLTVDLQRALVAAPAEDQAFLAQQLQALGVAQLPTEVWLDDQGRLRRQTYLADLTRGGADLDAAADRDTPLPDAMVTTVEYDDFGAPVEITLPAPEEVTDVADLIDGALVDPS
ncbi:MAG: hypothetical protein GEU81_11460 [Nitriliruptorales bacterium]|nr:hypothetical protein [Nitriliruptorales bacterium]